jgi:cytidylate kinase
MEYSQMNQPEIIAIDGPAGSGKSTIGKLVAEEFGYLYFDTGVMYRAVTFAAINKDININDEESISLLVKEIKIDIRTPIIADGRDNDVLVNGQDVTWEIRSPEVDGNVSIVSSYPEVRTALGEQQRRIGLQGEVVMVGRDIGTVILPEADIKIYLDASIEERADRRYQELRQRGEEIDFDSILAKLRERDLIDSTREIAPLKPADDAIVIDTDQLSIQQVFAKIIEIVNENRGK